jgi:cation transport protein ChaC
MTEELLASLVLRDPKALLVEARRGWDGESDLWVFGYGSLIWRPDFEYVERRMAVVHGFHRALEMRSRVNRGTPECPGLVFAMVSGGSCRGVAYRIAREHAERELERLWLREMPTGVYDARWLRCRTVGSDHHVHEAQALAFTLDRRSPNYTGPIGDEEMIAILGQACGRYGSTLDYLLDTARSLEECCIRDREIERLVALARAHALA